jgi:acyl-CoA dehydrogenase
MYSFEPNDEQKILIDSIKHFANGELRKAAREAEESKCLPRELIEKGWELGILQASIPEAYGGYGERLVINGVLAAEEMAYGDLAGSLAVGVPGLFALPILLAGSEEQKKEYLPQVVGAQWKSYTAALIEASYDFDPNDLKTFAKIDGNHYVLDGSKVLVPFADKAEALIVYANLDGKTRGFIVSKNEAGLKIEGSRGKYLGLNAIPFYKVSLEGVKIPKANLLQGEFAPILDAGRVAIAAMGVGLARAAFEYARDYAKERNVFGVKVAQKQAIAFMLAEMATEIEAIRLLVWDAAWAIDRNKEDASQKAYLAVTGTIDMAMLVTDRAVQILGGHGYIRDHPVEMWMRNGRGLATFTGLAML